MPYTIKSLNKIAAKHELELVKGAGYFYWVHPTAFVDSIFINSFNHGNKKFWLAELESAINQLKLLLEER